MHWIDPSVLPVVEGTIACFIRNPRGDVDGVLLGDDRQIHVPPHMGAGVEKLFAIGHTIEARCIKPREGDVFAAVSVTSASGKSLVDDGPLPQHGRTASDHGVRPKKPEPSTRSIDQVGRVRRTLYAPRGEVAGAVLESGVQLRVDPKGNAALAPYFAAGAEIRAWGQALRRKGTTVVEVAEIGFSQDFD